MNAAISVLILTKNEEQDLSDCLESVSWSDDVHVYDSFSEDQTVVIAKTMGTIVTQHVFEGYASQRNAALHGLAFRHPWVLILDADERVSAPSPNKCQLLSSALWHRMWPHAACGGAIFPWAPGLNMHRFHPITSA